MLNNINDLLLVASNQEEPYYEVLEYISLDGTQYFDTGYYGSNATDIRAGMRFASLDSNMGLFGARDGGANVNNIACIFAKSNIPPMLAVDFNNSNYSNYRASAYTANSSTVLLEANKWYDITCNRKNRSILDNNTVVGTESSTVNNDTFSPTHTLHIGLAKGVVITGQTYNGFIGDIRYFKDLGEGVDYIPVLDDKMRPCLYDRISKTFLYAKNISDDEITYNLGFKRWNKYEVDYIASDGNQYIDTGYKFTNTSAFEITCAEVADFEASTVLCGARNNTDTTTNARIVDYSYSAPSVLRGEYLLLQRGGYDVNENVIYIPYDKKFHTYYQSPTRMSIDDTDRPTIPSLVSPNMNFYIFWQNVGTANAPAKAKIKVKNCKLWDNDTLVRDYKPVVWHNGDVTAEACLYDEVYNKMYTNAGTGSFGAYIEDIQIPYTLAMHDSMDITIGSGAYINANGVVTVDNASCYTKAIPVKEGDVITLTVTGRATTVPYNKRIHGYTSDDGAIPVGSTGSWVQQFDFINFPAGQTEYTTQQITVTVPSGINYIRLSHCIIASSTQTVMETQCDLTITRTYEVGTYIQTLKTSTVQTTGYMVDLGIEPKDGIGYHIKTSTNSNSSNYVFGARKATSTPTQQSTKPILIGLTGSQTGATILSSVMGASATWKSDNTNWVRPSSSTSSYVYECSLQTYKENHELKFNVIGYNYTLAKDADKQTLTYTDAIDNADEADMSTLHIGGLNANNILNGNNAYFFIEYRQPNTNTTLLPVINNDQLYLIDIKSKETYQFYKVGSPTPATDNIRIKKLDGTFVNGTL